MFKILASLVFAALLAPLVSPCRSLGAGMEGGGVMLIGARNAMFVRYPNVVPTAKDYVQDGLVAMWDGIENAGWGVHDTNATTWKDLVGNMDCYASSGIATPVFNANSISFDGTKASYRFDCSSNFASTRGAGITVELAAEGKIIQPDFGLFTIFPPGSWSFQNSVVIRGAFGGAITVANQYNQEALLPVSGQQGENLCISCFFPSSSTRQFRLYYMGQDTPLTSRGSPNNKTLTYGMIGYGGTNDYPEGFIGKIFSIRIYNRALTAAEIAANYAIDKARFNLP